MKQIGFGYNAEDNKNPMQPPDSGDKPNNEVPLGPDGKPINQDDLLKKILSGMGINGEPSENDKAYIKAQEDEKRLQSAALYAATKGFMIKVDQEAVHQKYVEFKMRIRKGCFDITWLEDNLIKRYGPIDKTKRNSNEQD